jgi:hypothetical protein
MRVILNRYRAKEKPRLRPLRRRVCGQKTQEARFVRGGYLDREPRKPPS